MTDERPISGIDVFLAIISGEPELTGISVVFMLDEHATPDHVGIIPEMLDSRDPRPAREQLNSGYAHGGGWHPSGQNQWKLGKDFSLSYPGDPTLVPLALIMLRKEAIFIYQHGLVAIVQPDLSFEVSRMD